MKVLREPLIQFLFIGLCIYSAYAFYGVADEGSENKTVTVSSERISAFISGWESRWKRPPTNQELTGLINQFIREDIFYREAIAMGLDKDDPVTRRRLAKKLEFLSKDIASMKEPVAGELERYFENNIEDYKTPDLITFAHVFIDPDKRKDATMDDAAKLLAHLQSAGPPDESTFRQGDRFMLPSYYPENSELAIRKQFGSDFASAVMKLEPEKWHGPVLSGYGIHLVYVDTLIIAPTPIFKEVEEDVMQNWLADQQEQFNEEYFENLKSRYEIVIENTPSRSDNEILKNKDIGEKAGPS